MNKEALKYFLIGFGGGAALTGLAWIITATGKPGANRPVKSILFVGDSNTAANFSYADQLQSRYPTLKIKKLALSGAKTDWMLQELTKELRQTRYDAVAILGGSNDIYATARIDAAKLNLEAMYKLARDKGAKVIAIAPPNKNWYVNKTDQKQTLLRQLVDWIKAQPGKDYFINFWDLTNNKNFFTQADGYLHAQAPAHKLLADKTAQLLKIEA